MRPVRPAKAVVVAVAAADSVAGAAAAEAAGAAEAEAAGAGATGSSLGLPSTGIETLFPRLNLTRRVQGIGVPAPWCPNGTGAAYFFSAFPTFFSTEATAAASLPVRSA